jgi:hypothetical protein
MIIFILIRFFAGLQPSPGPQGRQGHCRTQYAENQISKAKKKGMA